MKIVIAGNYGAGNIGDESILKGLLKCLNKAAPYSDITVLSGDPAQTENMHYVNSCEKYPAGFRSLIKSLFGLLSPARKEIKQSDIFVLGGGGLFGGLRAKANLIWGIQTLVAYYYKKPVIMCGQSVGPIQNVLLKSFIRFLFNKASFIAVRDQSSKKRLQKIGVKREIHTVPDLAFFGKSDNEPPRKKKDTVLVSLSSMANLSLSKMKALANFFDWLIQEHKFNIKFISFQLRTDSDEHLHEEFLGLVRSKDKTEHLDNSNLDTIEKLFAKARFLIGMRLHSIITAIKNETPFIALNYAPKVKDLLKKTPFSKYDLEINDIEEGVLQDLFTDLLIREEAVKNELRDYNKNMEKRHKEIMDLFKDFIRNTSLGAR